jgi:hypothetical protein
VFVCLGARVFTPSSRSDMSLIAVQYRGQKVVIMYPHVRDIPLTMPTHWSAYVISLPNLNSHLQLVVQHVGSGWLGDRKDRVSGFRGSHGKCQELHPGADPREP